MYAYTKKASDKNMFDILIDHFYSELLLDPISEIIIKEVNASLWDDTQYAQNYLEDFVTNYDKYKTINMIHNIEKKDTNNKQYMTLRHSEKIWDNCMKSFEELINC